MSLESQYFEMYKSVDAFCKDILSGTPVYDNDGKEVFGVSAYICTMEQTSELRIVNKRQWKDTYYTLKHLRWLRNRIAHDVSVSELKQEDYDKLKNFYDSLLSQADPLTALNHYPARKTVDTYATLSGIPKPKNYKGNFYSTGRQNVSNRTEDTSINRIAIIALVLILGFAFFMYLGIKFGGY